MRGGCSRGKYACTVRNPFGGETPFKMGFPYYKLGRGEEKRGAKTTPHQMVPILFVDGVVLRVERDTAGHEAVYIPRESVKKVIERSWVFGEWGECRKLKKSS